MRVATVCRAVACAAVLAVAASAQGPVNRHEFPRPNQVPIDLALTIDLPVLSSYQYGTFDVELRTASGRPSPRTRRLHLEIGIDTTRPASIWNTVSHVDLVLERGKTSVRAVGTLLPSPYIDMEHRLVTTEDGTRVESLSGLLPPHPRRLAASHFRPMVVLIDRDVTPHRNGTAGSVSRGDGKVLDVELLSRCHDVDSTLEELRKVAIELAKKADRRSASPNAIEAEEWFRISGMVFGVFAWRPDEAPRSWRDYGRCDLVLVPWNELTWWVENEPDRFAALRTWVAMGGNLVIVGAEESQRRQ